MADDKWIHDLTAKTSLADAARRALTVRLEAVRDYLPLALHESEKDSEYMHQLRVGTRRARAALDIFACCLPSGVYKTAKKRLRTIRRSAGAARDWDVFLAGLSEKQSRRSSPRRPGLDFLVGYAFRQRQAAQTDLLQSQNSDPFPLDRFLAETVASVHKPNDDRHHTLADLARPLLSDLLHDLDEAAARDLDDYDHLHQVRICGKRLRYAMEVFAECFDPFFRDQLYPAVEEVQEILGNANDSHGTTAHLKALRGQLRAMLPKEWKRFQPGVEWLLRHHQSRLSRERRRFLKWWNHWQRAGERAAFLGLLTTG